MKKVLILLAFVTIAGMARAQNVIASTELEAQNVNEVRIEGSFCDVYVERGDRNYVTGVIKGKGEKGDYTFDTEITGSTLVVKVIRKDRRSWKGYNLSESKIELTIRDGVKLDIDNSSGDIYVTGLSTDDSKIEATSGDITLKRIQADIEVETSSGDISIDQLTGALEIQSTSGDQRIYNTDGDIDSRASSGDITISNFNGKMEMETTSGDVDIRGGIGILNVQTTSGNIEGDDIDLKGDAYFRASSGDVEIDFLNDLSEMSFDLTATSGNLSVGNKSGEKKLYIDRGGYKVTGVTSSGNQEYD
ncbi:MAG: DUF4097 family beta strand repeat-containing protein [Cyclobacteriaceae bacterium]